MSCLISYVHIHYSHKEKQQQREGEELQETKGERTQHDVLLETSEQGSDKLGPQRGEHAREEVGSGREGVVHGFVIDLRVCVCVEGKGEGGTKGRKRRWRESMRKEERKSYNIHTQAHRGTPVHTCRLGFSVANTKYPNTSAAS